MTLLSYYMISEQMEDERSPAKGKQGSDVQKHLQCWCISDAPLCSPRTTQSVHNETIIMTNERCVYLWG